MATTPQLPRTVRSDSRSRFVLPGHPDEFWIVRDHGDVITLERALVVSEAQHAYDTDATFRSQIDEALASPTANHEPRW